MRIVRKILIIVVAFTTVSALSAPASAGPAYEMCMVGYEAAKYHWNGTPDFCGVVDPFE